MKGSEPFVVTTYGPSGIGKTTDMGYSFPTALFVAAPGALSSIESVCGYLPARAESIHDIGGATDLIRKVGGEGTYETVVIDDFSFLAEQTFALLEKRHSGFKLWGALREIVLEFRNQSRYAGMNVVLGAGTEDPRERAEGSWRSTALRQPPRPAPCDVRRGSSRCRGALAAAVADRLPLRGQPDVQYEGPIRRGLSCSSCPHESRGASPCFRSLHHEASGHRRARRASSGYLPDPRW